MPIRLVLADTGYDSEPNYCVARHELGVGTRIPAKNGRPGRNGLKGYYRRLMQRRLKAGPDKRCYGQRRQVETVKSMIKGNLGGSANFPGVLVNATIQ